MKQSRVVLICTLLTMCSVTFSASGASAQHQHGNQAETHSTQPPLATPSSIREEHQHLHHQLDEALASGGETAVRARAVADVLLPHFKAEEEYAMPPLGLLTAIANGEPLTSDQRRQAIHMARDLRSHYEQMLQEHQQIHSALEALASTARQENKPRVVAFAETLMLHAQNEEQVLYPTTLLIGKYLEQHSAAGQ
ncbi:MAG TPA: hemerythrin domain-containing protein [Acidobacteriaceae bacterium]|nr:hemerythrin domain-containing protein [Acidobacteriaceae bacterium]